MDIKQAKEIIKSENLNGKNLFNTDHLHEDEVAIEKTSDNKYIVFMTEERKVRIGVVEFTSESDALIDYIERLRADKELWEIRQRREQKKREEKK